MSGIALNETLLNACNWEGDTYLNSLVDPKEDSAVG